MTRHRAPAVSLTPAQRDLVDKAVLSYIRTNQNVRAGEIEYSVLVIAAVESLPKAKAPGRYVGESLQRLKLAGKVELGRARWRTA